MRLVRGSLLACGMLVATVVVLTILNYFFLWKPSLQGKCLESPQFRGSASTLPRLAGFHGEVVGKNLWIVQYRWLRRRFTAVGTTLSLERELPPTEYQGNVVLHSEKVADVVIDKSGSFDFGGLTEGEYGLTVTYPGEDAVGFGFVIDRAAHNRDVLIDASPASYCRCCGWDFEPRDNPVVCVGGLCLR